MFFALQVRGWTRKLEIDNKQEEEKKNMQISRLVLTAALALAGISGSTIAAPIDGTYTANTLPANDDGSTKPAYTKDFLHLNVEGYEALNRELIRSLSL